jgi:peptidoglycan-N-acetylglucosamine deacetylase
MALTFDDGPNPAATPQVLDLLARHEAKATFFLIGRHVRAFPEIAKEIAGRGHAIGNHTESHPSLALLSSARIAEELDRCDQAILSNAMATPRWVRPPYGYRSPLLNGIVMRRGNAGVAMWSAMARDWKTQAAEPVIQRLRRARGGDIVLLHDGDHRVLRGDRGHVVKAMEYWLPRWKDSGIHLVSMDEIERKLQAD